MQISTTKNTVNLVSTITSGYKYIHVIEKVTTTEVTLENSEFTESSSSYDLLTDGYYNIIEIKLPDSYSEGIYYIDGETIYSPVGVITLEELLEVDVEGTNILREDNDYFLYYFLETYYIDLIQSKFLKSICTCSCVNSQDRVTIDTLTMGLELIKKLVEYLQYMEAERMIEQLSTCSGIINTNCNCNG